MEGFIELVKGAGPEGLYVGFFVLLFVYALSAGGVVVTKGQKQSANVVLSILLSGLQLLNPKDEQALIAAIASIASAVAYEFVRWLAAKQKELATK